MTRAPFLKILLPCSLLTACGSAVSTNTALPDTAGPYLGASGPNVLALKVGGGAVCSQPGYQNELCTTITVCMPGTTQCQAVSDVLVDTGSVGLRIFQTVLGFSLPWRTEPSGNTLAECAQFGVGADWGPLATADVALGGEKASEIPVQLISNGFATPPSACAQADTSPQQAGFNGILGIGSFNEDCGPICARTTAVQMYFSCDGSTCGPVTMPQARQLQNPVSHLAADNNGVVIALPQVAASGAGQVSGVMILGIGTEANNAPIGVHPYLTDGAGNFVTQLGAGVYPGSFIDSGSNGIFFPNSTGLRPCPMGGPAAGFYCPTALTNLAASNFSQSAGSQATIAFQIGDAQALFSGSNSAFSDVGGSVSGSVDWGLPFFYGRAVLNGIEGRESSLGTGPYWAY